MAKGSAQCDLKVVIGHVIWKLSAQSKRAFGVRQLEPKILCLRPGVDRDKTKIRQLQDNVSSFVGIVWMLLEALKIELLVKVWWVLMLWNKIIYSFGTELLQLNCVQRFLHFNDSRSPLELGLGVGDWGLGAGQFRCFQHSCSVMRRIPSPGLRAVWHHP